MLCSGNFPHSPWNASKLPSFTPIHGMHQGDPLSHYLFVLFMEKLVCLISKKVLGKSWYPIHVSKGGLVISHLFFADDILLFTKASNTSFCIASGLKVNFEKS